MSGTYKGKYTSSDLIYKDYRCHSYIGEGDFGTVFRVQNANGIFFALKILFDREGKIDAAAEERGFETIKKVSSFRVVKMMEFGRTVDGEPCLLMDFHRLSLEDYLAKKGALPVKEACHWFRELLKALAVLEPKAIIHRDLKPANLFIQEDIIKIGDFGTLKFFEEDSSGQTTKTAKPPYYAAPERFGHNYGMAVDRWAAAVVFYRMLTGTFPFPGRDVIEIFGSVKEGEPDYKGVPEKLKPFLKTCFRKASKDRHPDVAAMAADFDAALAGMAGTVRPASLRAEPMTVSKDDFKKVFGLNDNRKPLEYVQNQYRDNGDGSISDLATGLMWQRSGSEAYMKRKKVPGYIDALNKKRFAGFSDWRLPTIPELMSLLEPEEENGDLYINPLFYNKQRWCWSSDGVAGSPGAGWLLLFDVGHVDWDDHVIDYFVRVVRSQSITNIP